MVFDTARFLEIPGFSEAQKLRKSGRFLGPARLVSESPSSGLESLDRIGPMYMVTYI